MVLKELKKWQDISEQRKHLIPQEQLQTSLVLILQCYSQKINDL